MKVYKTRHRHELDFGITNYSQVKVKMPMNEEEQLKANREYTTSCIIQTTSQFTVSLPPFTHGTQGGVVTNSVTT